MKRRLLVASAFAVGLGLVPGTAGADVPLTCDLVPRVEAGYYERASWEDYGDMVGFLAVSCHRRFRPFDPAWAQAEQDWWVNLSWHDYGMQLRRVIRDHHVRMVPA